MSTNRQSVLIHPVPVRPQLVGSPRPKRAQARRVQWDNKMRDAFDRNLNEIDQAVNEYTMILQQDPQDELSGEMLDSALDDKMKLLREFSEL